MPAPNYFLGNDTLSVNVYGATRNATTGVVTWSSTPSPIPTGSDGAGGASLDYWRISDQRVLEMIVALGSGDAHYEKILMDSTLVVGEILKRSGNVLQTLVDTNQLLKVVIVTSAGTYTYHGTIRLFNDGASALGKNSHEVTLAPFKDGTNPPLAWAPAA